MDLSGNAVSGTLPTFATNAELERLDLSRNALSGTLPALAALTRLKELRLAHNALSGTLPSSSWRALRALELVDVAQNQLSGRIHLFTPDSQLPPLGALFVDVSSNRFDGEFAELPPSLNLTSINIRSNRLLCPYPLFPLSMRVLRSACIDDWAQLGTNAGIGAGALAVGAVLFLGIKQLVSERTVRIALFARAWLTSAAGLLSDALSYTFIVQYLEKRSNNCALINEARVFVPQLAVVFFPSALRSVPDTYAFADWIHPRNWPIAESNGLDEVPTYTARFIAACRQAPECSYDASLSRCAETHPDLATSGGAAHQTFFGVVMACIAIRCAFELFCLVIIVAGVAFRGGSGGESGGGSVCSWQTVVRFRVWIVSSVFLPLLAARADTRASVLNDMVLVDPSPLDYIWLLCTTGVFVSGAKLFADLYFLLRVAQTGLVWSNWVSLVLGAITAPLLVTQAALSWRKLWYERLEEHYAERAESGWNDEFAAENMAVGGIESGTADNEDALEAPPGSGADSGTDSGTGPNGTANATGNVTGNDTGNGASAAESGVQHMEMTVIGIGAPRDSPSNRGAGESALI